MGGTLPKAVVTDKDVVASDEGCTDKQTGQVCWDATLEGDHPLKITFSRAASLVNKSGQRRIFCG
eukprot:1695097-Amphidinium_carterae.1